MGNPLSETVNKLTINLQLKNGFFVTKDCNTSALKTESYFLLGPVTIQRLQVKTFRACTFASQKFFQFYFTFYSL